MGRGSAKQEWIYLLVAILLGLMVRLLAVVALGERFHEDPDAYQRLAKQWTETSSFALLPKELNSKEGQDTDEAEAYPTESRAYPTAFRPPLYPLVLSCLQHTGFSPSASVITLHLILGLLTCGGTYWLGRNWLNRPMSLLASALVAADPILVFQSVQVMTETMATYLGLMILLLWVWSIETRRIAGYWWTGLVLGLAILCRPPFVLWAPFLALFTVIRKEEKPNCDSEGHSRWAHVLLLTVSTLLVVAPWVYRNYRIFGEPKLTTTHGGYTLLLANNRSFYAAFSQGERLGDWEAETPEFQAILSHAYPFQVRSSEGELKRDRAYSEAAWKTMVASPSLFLQTSLVRLCWFWSPMPHGSQEESGARHTLRICIGVFYCIQFGFAAYGAKQFGTWATATKWCFIGWLSFAFALTALHSVYWSNLRMRAPLVPMLTVLSILGVCSLLQNIQRKGNPLFAPQVEVE